MDELEQEISTVLGRVNYYRLAPYWNNFRELLADEKRGKSFLPGTNWETVCAYYDFDRRLRLLLFEAISIIEIALREKITDVLTRQNRSCVNPQFVIRHFERKFRAAQKRVVKRRMCSGDLVAGEDCDDESVFVHIREEYCSKIIKTESLYGEFMRKVQKAYTASNAEFSLHYREKKKIKYAQFLPIWVFMEHLTFGNLRSLLSVGLRRSYVDDIAASLGLSSSQLFVSAIALLHRVRNQCAHQGRIWNRQWIRQNKQGALPPILKTDAYYKLVAHYKSDGANTLMDCRACPSPTSTAAVIMICQILLHTISPGNDWGERVNALFRSCPISTLAAETGF